MLSICLFHIFISIVCLLAGFISLTCLSKLSSQNELYRPIVVYLITGAVAIALISQCLVIFLPLNIYTTTFIWLIILSGSLLLRKRLASYIVYLFAQLSACSRLKIAIVLSAWLMILIISAGPIIMDDTGSYHIQIIKWTQEYGTVKGLVNLHERFAFNSAWLTLVSVFSPANAIHNYYTAFNSLLSLWFMAYLLSELFNHTRSSDRLRILIILFYAIWCWPLLRGNAATANYDFITTVVTIVLFLELWKRRADNNPDHYPLTEMLVWPVFLFTVRIINWPLLLISLFAIVELIRRRKLSLVYCCCSVCLLSFVVFLLRNVLLSGYLFYPVYQIDLFSFDWKGEATDAKQLVDFIKYFNRVPSLAIEETSKLTGIRWLPAWFNDLQWCDKSIVITCGAGILVQFIRFRQLAKMNSAVRWILIVLIIQLINWLVIAPDTRFAYAPLLAGSCLLATSFKLPAFIRISDSGLQRAGAILAATMLLYGSIKLIYHKEYRNVFTPVLLPVPVAQTIWVSGTAFHIPGKVDNNWNARCYGTCLPCLYLIKPGLKARGAEIKDGFKIEK